MVTPMNRRSFLAMTGLAGAGLLGAGSLAGCGSGSGSGSTYTIQFWEAFQFSNESQFFTDYFVTPFVMQDLRGVDGHALLERFVEYHNERVGKGAVGH